jgi:hypothetical protein
MALQGVARFHLLQRGDQQLQLSDLLLPAREEHLRLEVEQVGGHLDELARDLQIHRLHLVEIGEVLLQDLGDADVPDLDFVFAEQHQDERQGPSKSSISSFVRMTPVSR